MTIAIAAGAGPFYSIDASDRVRRLGITLGVADVTRAREAR